MIFKSHRAALIGSFLAVALIPLIVLALYQSYLIGQNVESAHERQNAAALQVAAELTSFVEMHRRGIEAAAQQVTENGRRSKEDFDAILSSLHRQFPGFINLYFADTKAKTLAFYPEFNAQGQSMVGADFSSRWHYKELQKELKTYISPVMKGVGGTEKLLCTIVAPYFDRNGAFDGFVLGALNLEKIGPLVDRLVISPDTYAVVTDAWGQAIYAPGWSADKLPSRVDLKRILPEHLSPETTQRTRHVSPVTHQTVVSSFARMDDPNWYIWLSTPAALEDALLNRWVLASAALIAFTLLAVLVASRLLSAPLAASIETLCRKAGLIKENRYKPAEELAVRSDAPKELQTLDQAFNLMARSLAGARGELLKTNAQLEARVKARTATLSRALKSMREGFGVIDIEGRFAVLNDALTAFIGQEPVPGSYRREDFEALLTEKTDLTQEQAQALLRAPNTGVTAGDDKGRVWLLASFEVHDANAVYGLGLVLRDITEQHRLDAMKNELISVVAHEFKTPLASMRMQAETLARTDVDWDEETRRELTEGMLDDAKRLEVLVRDWLDVSRIESQSLTLRPRRINPRSLIEQAHKTAAPAARLTMTEIGLKVPCTADADRLLQIFINLFSNAVRYCDRVPKIEILVNRTPDELIFDITDNGIGIAAENREKVFEKFHQVDMSASRRAGGTGLGLTISRGLARAHGGDLVIRSSSPEGTTLTLTLPQRSPEK